MAIDSTAVVVVVRTTFRLILTIIIIIRAYPSAGPAGG